MNRSRAQSKTRWLIPGALLVASLSVGCFWLEPVRQMEDGGSIPDPDSGDPSPFTPCENVDAAPLGARLEWSLDEAWFQRTSEEGEVVSNEFKTNEPLKVRLSFSGERSYPVAVRVTSENSETAEPDVQHLCFNENDEEPVPLHLKKSGVTKLTAAVGKEGGGDSKKTEILVFTDAPEFSVAPRHGFVNPQEEGQLVLRLSEAFQRPVRVAVDVQVDGWDDLIIPAGETEITLPYPIPEQREEELLKPIFDTPFGPVETDFRWAPMNLLISEFQLDRTGGFVELYNPGPQFQALGRVKDNINQVLSVVVAWEAVPGAPAYQRLCRLDRNSGVEGYAFRLSTWDGEGGPQCDVGALPEERVVKGLFLVWEKDVGGPFDFSSAETVDRVWSSDGLHLEDGASYERMAWEGADADSMSGEGVYAKVGNAWDRDLELVESIADFYVRPIPEPQGSDVKESLFGGHGGGD